MSPRPWPVQETITVQIPFRLEKRGGRKEVVLPPGAEVQTKMDCTLVKAIARAFRWKRMLETGEFATLAELAAKEAIAASYMARMMKLTLLAPDIAEAVMDGKQGPDITLAGLMAPFTAEWAGQNPSGYK